MNSAFLRLPFKGAPVVMPFFLLAALLVTVLAGIGCGTESSQQEQPAEYGASLPVFAWITSEIVGGFTNVESLITETQSPHTYHPRPSDMGRLHSIRVLILGSPDLDGWAAELTDKPVIYLSEFVKPEDWIEDGSVRNPHFWLDPQIVRSILTPLTGRLCELEAERCAEFQHNSSAFAQSLDTVDRQIQSLFDAFAGTRFYVAQPFFDYFLKRYGLEIVTTLETVPGYEPPASRMVDLLSHQHENSGVAILTHKRLPQTTARLVESETSLPLLELDPIGGLEAESYGVWLMQIAEALRAILDPAP